MSIHELLELVQPPTHPTRVGTDEQWAEVERAVGLALPADYKEFIRAYGSGHFARFYSVYSPFTDFNYTGLLPSILRVCDAERSFKREVPDRSPFPIHPEVPGLLPWACDENGNFYFWLTSGHPDGWNVIVNEVRGDGYSQYDCSMTAYLARVLRGEIQALASDYPMVEDRVFEPWATVSRP
jgi:SMI1-KNR4 cell-wall